MKRFILTIGREYGTGGRNTGIKIAELLGVKCYDSELITMAATKSGMNMHLLDDIDETAANSLMYTLAIGSSGFAGFGGAVNMPINDKLFLLQADIIRDIAKQGSAVIVGRCADYILRDDPDLVNIFFYAPLEARKANVAERKGVSLDKAASLITKKEKGRKNYYNYYTGSKWGDRSNYQLCIDPTVLGIDKTAEVIAKYLELR